MSTNARRSAVLWISLALLACGVHPEPSEAASLADRIFDGFLSFGRGFSNATQGFVVRVRGLVTRIGGPSSTSGSNRGASVTDIFASVCSLSGSSRRSLIKCLDENNENLVHVMEPHLVETSGAIYYGVFHNHIVVLLKPDWQNCIGSAKVEVLTVEDLYHWACSRLSSETELQEFRNTSQCLLEGMQISDIAAGIRECKGSSRTF